MVRDATAARNIGRLASIIPLAVAAAVYPTLLAGVIVLLARDKPAPLLAGFLAGGVLISVTTGLIIVFALGGAVSTKNQNSASPAIDLIAGILSVILAGVLWKRQHDKRGNPQATPEKRRMALHGRSELWEEARAGPRSALG
jgi:Sap, sulfolipid-1-addressing protein